MDLVNIVGSMSAEKVKLLLLLYQDTQTEKVVIPESEITGTTDTNTETAETNTEPPTTEPEKVAETNTEPPEILGKTPETTAELNINILPKQKLSRGKHRAGAVKPESELSTNPIAILRRQQYHEKKQDPLFMAQKAKKAKEYRARKKLEKEQQQD
jgi:hypothetical protein